MTRQEVLGLLEERVKEAEEEYDLKEAAASTAVNQADEAGIRLATTKGDLAAMEALYAAEARKAASKARPEEPPAAGDGEKGQGNV